MKQGSRQTGFHGTLGTPGVAYLMYDKYLSLLIWLCVCRFLVNDTYGEGCIEQSGEGILSQTAHLGSQ